MIQQTFINLPVKDLSATINFFKKLDFKFNPKFTDNNATCMILNSNTFVMLLVEQSFKTFIKTEINDAHKQTEVLVALQVESREKVDELLTKAKGAGAKEFRESQDHGWMYIRAFQDIDGHIWEIFFMDESKVPQAI